MIREIYIEVQRKFRSFHTESLYMIQTPPVVLFATYTTRRDELFRQPVVILNLGNFIYEF